MLDGKMGNFGAQKLKKHGCGWQQGYVGGALVKAPEETWGKKGENWGEIGEMGENGGSNGG